MTSNSTFKLDQIDHIAISVADVKSAISWYRSHFQCDLIYEDETWAFLKFGNIKLALVVPDQHPPHIAFVSDRAAEFGQLKPHRDGTRSLYLADPAGNSVEIMAPYAVTREGSTE